MTKRIKKKIKIIFGSNGNFCNRIEFSIFYNNNKKKTFKYLIVNYTVLLFDQEKTIDLSILLQFQQVYD